MQSKIVVFRLYSSGSKEFKNQILTYLCAMGLACGVNYISMGVAGRIEKPFLLKFSRVALRKNS